MNEKCEYYIIDDEGNEWCKVKIDKMFCGINCAFATNVPCSNKTRTKGRPKKGRKCQFKA